MPGVTLSSLTTFGDLLKHLRRRARLTQRELGIAVGYSEAHVARLENGQRHPDLTTVRTLLVPALGLDKEPTLANRLVELAEADRGPAPDDAAPDESGSPQAEVAEHPNNLPTQLTRFIGRQRELAEVTRLLGDARLLTITGSAGAGKTRLALQVAAGVLGQYRDGVWLVELAGLSDPRLIPDAVASALGLRAGGGANGGANAGALGALADPLRAKAMLLILDNCEHLIAACASTAESLLRACPGLRLLATSREPLDIPGERVWRIPSLATSEAVEVFADRAGAARAGFTLTEHNRPSIAQICERLDGLPLAIELAASRLRALSVEQITTRLDDRFNLLTGGARTALPRHQTLRTLIDWSYDLLSEPERLLLGRLSVFAGGWTLEAAEAACAEKDEGRRMKDESEDLLHPSSFILHPSDVLPLLFDLVSKSLVVVDERAEETRYRLIETVRQYGLAKLRESGELDLIQRRHAAAYLALAEQAEPNLFSRWQALWAARLTREHDNFRAALAWSQDAGGDATTGWRLAGALWTYWLWFGSVQEGRRWLEDLLANPAPGMGAFPRRGEASPPNLCPARPDGDASPLPGGLPPLRNAPPGIPPSARAQVLLGSVVLAFAEGAPGPSDLDRFCARLDEALAIFRESGNQPGIVIAQCLLATAAWDHDGAAAAQSLLEQSLVIARQVTRAPVVAWPLEQLSYLATWRGDWTRALAYLEEYLAAGRKSENELVTAEALAKLGLVALRQLDFRRAIALSEQSLQAGRRIGYRRIETPALMQIGEAARYLGDFGRARAAIEELSADSAATDNTFGSGFALQLLGKIARDEGNFPRARDLFAQSLGCRERLGAWSIPYNLEGLASVASAEGQAERAARLFGAAEAIREAIHTPLWPDNLPEYGRQVAAVRAQLDEATFASAWADGRAMTTEQAVADALGGERVLS